MANASSRAWPADGLQALGRCPICRSGERTVLHEALADLAFGAPGLWTLHRCAACGVAYLDPRPTDRSILLAYESYCTHGERLDDDPAAGGDGIVGRLKQAVLRHYVAAHFGPVDTQRARFLAPLAKLRPRAAQGFDVAMRHLPRPRPHATLLDVGCGSGRFMAWARAAGWTCTGTEIDPRAAARARSRGLEVVEGDPAELATTGRQFDAITLSHVIEHVFEPVPMLAQLRAMLRPGGHFWIETPNIDSMGHERFGRHWRGLEPPRHLQIFHPALLASLLRDAGFEDVQPAPWQAEWRSMAAESSALAAADHAAAPGADELRRLESVGRADAQRREFITLTATTGRAA